MHKLDLWFFFFSYFLHDLQGPTTAHKTFTQSRHVAGICSSRGVDEYSEAKLPPRPWETWHTHTHTTTTTTKDPHCLSLQVSLSLSLSGTIPSTFPWCGGVRPTLHRCDPLRPVKASTPPALWSGRQKEQLRIYSRQRPNNHREPPIGHLGKLINQDCKMHRCHRWTDRWGSPLSLHSTR